MTREQDFERRLSEWTAEGPVAAPAEVVDEALRRCAGRRQHLPARVRIATALERVWAYPDSGRRPLRLAMAVVLLAVFLSSSLLVIGPLRGPGPAPAMDRAGAHYTTGSSEVTSTSASGDASLLVLRIEADDPRVSGQARQLLRIDKAPQSELERSRGVMRLENDWGAWEGVINAVRYPDGTQIEYGWLAGEGAYEGFSYFHSTRDHPAESERVLEGAIWPGEPPPMPDPSLLQADPLG